jgi:hypothetical protein
MLGKTAPKHRPYAYLIKHYDRKEREWKYSSTILDFDARWRRVVSFTPRPLYPRRRALRAHWIRSCVNPRAGLDTVEKRKHLTLPGIEFWSSSP